MTWTRRTALKSGLAASVGVLGVAALDSSTPALAAARRRSFSIRLGAVRSETVGKLASQFRRRGDSVLAHAEVLDEAGRAVGSFESSGTVTDERRRGRSSVVRGLHLHLFRLPGGDIIGAGAPTSGLTAGEFAVLGGTGEFSGCRGSYRVATAQRRGTLVTFALHD